MTQTPTERLSVADASALARSVLDEVEKAVIGKRTPLTLVLSAVLAKGHVLLEDFPGLGKTLAARSLARVLGLDFARVQFTPDLLPGRHHRLVPLQPEGGHLRVPARAALRRAGARRRDQPDAPEDPVGAARGDAGAAGHGRGRDLPPARPVPRARHGQPDRVRGHLPAARGAAGPVPDAGQLRLPHRRRGVRRGAAPARAPAGGRRPGSRSPTRPGCGRCRRRWRPSPWTSRSAATASTSRPPPATTRTSSPAPRRVARSAWPWPPAGSR